jgi:diguanylate cyclase (GGDEF)-like protein
MFKQPQWLVRYKLECVLAVMLVLTFIAIVGERWILRTRLVIEPHSYTGEIYDDRDAGGASVGTMIHDGRIYEWQCTLSNGNGHPYCGFEIVLAPFRQNGLDLRHYDHIQVWMDYIGDAPTLRLYLRNFNPAYSTPGENDSTKYNQVEFATDLLDQSVKFAIADFFVANWWTYSSGVPPHLAHPEFSNIVVVEVNTGTTTTEGKHHFRVHRIELVGQRLDTLVWYQILFGGWIAAAVIVFVSRLLQLKTEVHQRRRREKELLELNKLLNDRGEALEEKSKTDSLTGAFNREGIKDALKAGLAARRQTQSPMSLLIIDIDHFKSINDTHGHLAGDKILAQLSALVKANVRTGDSFARWGGEEFIVACSATSEAEGAALANKLRRLIERYDFENAIPVTVSIGVSALKPKDSLEELFARADRALYSAKNRGRNRVVVAED